jgi:hypothetical protein
VEPGTVEDVSYVGQATRYRVALAAGGTLLVSEQNFETSHAAALALHGAAVRLAWRDDQTSALNAGVPPADHPQKEPTS